MIALITLTLLGTMIAVTQFVPTAGETQAAFESAQKFYSSGAYDQAIENYQQIVRSRSKLLNMEEIRVVVGDIDAPLQEVAPYQIGNAYFRMGEEALERAATSRLEEKRNAYTEEARRLLEKAADSFVETESLATVSGLKALARSQAVACWYKLKAYERTIRGAQELIERYPNSRYVVQAMYDIGWAHYDTENYAASIKVFQALVDRFPKGYRVHRALFQIGESYFNLGEYDQAIPSYRRLVDSQRIGQMSEREILLMRREKIAGLVDETTIELAAKALIRMGVSYEKIGEYDKASEAFEVVAEQFADEQRLAEEALLRHADMHYNRGDFGACIAVYRHAIEIEREPLGKARMQLLLANRYFETEHYPEAVREYDIYRADYPERAAQAGLPIEGVGLQIARSWFRQADRLEPAERLDPYRRAEAELHATLRAYPGSRYDIELRFNLALALQRQEESQKMEEALQLFRGVSEAKNAQGYRHSALFQSARISAAQEDLPQAATTYRLLIEELADKSEADIARFELALAERDAGNWERAVEVFLQVRPEADLFGQSRLEAGQSLVRHDQHTRAIELLEEGANADLDTDVATLIQYLLAAAYSRLGAYEGALPHFDRAIALGAASLDEQAVYGRGVAYFKLGRYDEAIADLNYEWTDGEIAASAPRLLATAYTAADRPDKALQVYRGLDLSAATPLERGEYMLSLAEIEFRQGDYAGVVKTCQELLKLRFEESELPETRLYFIKEKARFLSAEAGARNDDFEGARKQAASGLADFPNGFYAPDFLFTAGLAVLQLDRDEEAVGPLGELLDRYPDHANAPYGRYYLAYAHFNQTHFSKALVAFRQLIKHPDLEIFPDAHFRATECLFNLGEFVEAERGYREFTRLFPDEPLAEDALYNIVWCRMNAAAGSVEEDEGVKEAFEEYLAHYPQGRHVATVRYTLGEISFNAGEYQRAYDLFREIEASYPGTEAATRAAEALPELREALAYKAYGVAMEIFNRAVEEDDKAGLREAIPRLDAVWKEYPETSSGIGAMVNVAVSYQKLEEWKRAVDAFGVIIAEGERGNEEVTPNVLAFCERRRGTIARKHL